MGTQDEIAAVIQADCTTLKPQTTRGGLGAALAKCPASIRPVIFVRWSRTSGDRYGTLPRSTERNSKRRSLPTCSVTYQNIRLMAQQGVFRTLKRSVTPHEQSYWEMVAAQCRPGTGDIRLRFLKFLLGGFAMIVRQEPGHPVGMRFPGGDRVQEIDGVYYCPVREKAGDVDAALCPFCPARQTPLSRVPASPG